MMPKVNTPGGQHRLLFRVVSTDDTSAQLQDEANYTFSVPRVVQEFLGSKITLQTGQIISAILAGPEQIRDAVVEDADFHERKIFESLGPAPNVPGWSPVNNPGHDAGKNPGPTIEWNGDESL
jgi:hypothetical protein